MCGCFVRRSRRSRATTEHNETEMLVPTMHAAIDAVGDPEGRPRLRVLGQPRLPPGRAVRVRLRPRRGRLRGRRCARATSRWTRRGRCTKRGSRIQTGEFDERARVRLRQVVARRPARDHDAADRPVLRACRCGRRWSTWPRCRRVPTSTRAASDEDDFAEVAARAQRNGKANPYAVRSGDLDAPSRCSPSRSRTTRCATPTSRRSPTAPRRW